MKRTSLIKKILSALAGVIFFSITTGPGYLLADQPRTPACDIQKGPCAAKTADGIDVQFDIQPKPVTAMSELSFVVDLNKNKMPVPDASVVIDLSMPGMYMGKNTPVLNHVSNGRYEGKGVFTRCMSGRKTWQADIRVAHGGKQEVISFVFEVQ